MCNNGGQGGGKVRISIHTSAADYAPVWLPPHSLPVLGTPLFLHLPAPCCLLQIYLCHSGCWPPVVAVCATCLHTTGNRFTAAGLTHQHTLIPTGPGKSIYGSGQKWVGYRQNGVAKGSGGGQIRTRKVMSLIAATSAKSNPLLSTTPSFPVER